jgi:hypothetical protein
MNRIFPLLISLAMTACADNGTVLGSQTSGGAAGSGTGGSTTQPNSGGSSSSAGGNPNPGVAGMTSGSGGASSAGAPGSGGQSGSGTSGGGTSSSAGAAGSGGAVNDECGGCAPPYQVCIYQIGGPGPSHFACAEQQPCGSALACACILGQGPCTWVADDDAGVTGNCHCDNGLE